MKQETAQHRKQAARTARATRRPQTLSTIDRLTGQRVNECFFPNGTVMQYTTIRTIPRNAYFTEVAAIRDPGLVLKLENDLCIVWFVWADGKLTGQFHAENEAVSFCVA